MASKDKAFYSKNTLNINGNLIDLQTPAIMGIINITDDSFYDGGRYLDAKSISRQVEQLINEGADIIDIGGYSSRPGADHIEEDVELSRVMKGVQAARQVSSSIPISVDTFRSNVARASIEAGAGMINDISGGSLDAAMFQTISEYNVSYILMHMKGNPQNMSSNVTYEDLLSEMLEYFVKKLQKLTLFGIKDVIIDVGFGFSKTTLQNFELLQKLADFRILNLPLLVGISRKSMVYKTLEIDPENALNGSTALHAISLLKGASIFRVHDVKEMKQVIDLLKLVKE